MLLMATPTQSLKVRQAIVVAVLVLMMNYQLLSGSTSLTGGFLMTPVSLDSPSPHGIQLSTVIPFSAYGGVVALSGAVTANREAILRDIVRLSAMLASQFVSVFVFPCSKVLTKTSAGTVLGFATSRLERLAAQLAGKGEHLPMIAAMSFNCKAVS